MSVCEDVSVQKGDKQSGRVLFVASVERHLRHFHTPFIQWFQSEGYEVHTAASGDNEIEGIDAHYDIPFTRSPYSAQNVKAYQMLKNLLRENRYQVIHCHTPNTSVLLRLAAREERKSGTTVIYTAHGFHFYKGAGAVNRLVYQMVEKLCSRFTDATLTMNQEDYDAAKQKSFACENVYLIHGMGFDPDRFHPAGEEERLLLRKKLDIPLHAFVLIFPGEYTDGKNQKMLFEVMKKISEQQEDILLLLPGRGEAAKEEEYRRLISGMNIGKCVRMLGYRPNIEEYLQASDLNVAPSKREGLPTHIVESFGCGIPCVATNTRGQVDIIKDTENGYLVQQGDVDGMAERIIRLYKDRVLYKKLAENAYRSSVIYRKDEIVKEHVMVYRDILQKKLCQK